MIKKFIMALSILMSENIHAAAHNNPVVAQRASVYDERVVAAKDRSIAIIYIQTQDLTRDLRNTYYQQIFEFCNRPQHAHKRNEDGHPIQEGAIRKLRTYSQSDENCPYKRIPINGIGTNIYTNVLLTRIWHIIINHMNAVEQDLMKDNLIRNLYEASLVCENGQTNHLVKTLEGFIPGIVIDFQPPTADEYILGFVERQGRRMFALDNNGDAFANIIINNEFDGTHEEFNQGMAAERARARQEIADIYGHTPLAAEVIERLEERVFARIQTRYDGILAERIRAMPIHERITYAQECQAAAHQARLDAVAQYDIASDALLSAMHYQNIVNDPVSARAAFSNARRQLAIAQAALVEENRLLNVTRAIRDDLVNRVTEAGANVIQNEIDARDAAEISFIQAENAATEAQNIVTALVELAADCRAEFNRRETFA